MRIAPVVLCMGVTLRLLETARADDLGYQLETSVASSYVVRGIPQYGSRRDPSSQNTAAVRLDRLGRGALTVVAWSAVALSQYDAQPGNSLEMDLSATYALRVDQVSLAFGYIAYLYPNHLAGTPLDGAHEISIVAAYDNRSVVPSIAVYVEPARQQGAYVAVGASRDLHRARWTITPSITFGAAGYRKYLGTDQAVGPHFNDVTASVGARRDLPRSCYATAKLTYALRGTPATAMPVDGASWGLAGRSTTVGIIAVGIAK